MAPPTQPIRKRANKRSVDQMLKQLSDEPIKGRESTKDPRFHNKRNASLSAAKGKNRKQIRKEARLLKKARVNAFNKNLNLDEVKVQLKPAERKITEKDRKKEKKLEKRRKEHQRKKLRLKQKKAEEREEAHKQSLNEANVEDERTIKRLEKDLHFNKNRKTKKKILPSIFKADGLDYLLDVVDPTKMDDLDGEEDEDDAAEEEDDEGLGLLDALGSDDDEDEDDEEMDDDVDDEEEEDIDDMEDEDERTSGRKNVRDDDGELDDEFSDTGEGSNSLKQSHSKTKRKQADAQNDEEDEEEGSSDDEDLKELRTLNKKQAELKMDPYGNIIGEKLPAKTGAYVPPQMRARMMGEDSQKKEQLERLRKQLKGLINRLSDANIKSISDQVEELYMKYSRNDMNETLTDLMLLSCVGNSLNPDRLIMEQMLLVAVLHTNVGNEIGAHFIQCLAVKFDGLYQDEPDTADKQCDNIIVLFTHLYNLKVIHCTIIYDLIRLLVERFQEKDIEMLLLLLRNSGMMLRKDDPSSLKDIILQIQNKAATCSEDFKAQSRVKFMLETIFAIRNNNLRKIPNFDPSHLEHLRKLLRSLIKERGHSDSDGTLRISFKDLLSAEDKGRWWIVGSAWVGNQHSNPTGETIATTEAAILGDRAGDKISELSRKQRMNTDIRRTIFGIIMTAEDYMDAFEKCLRLGLSGGREKEVVNVLLDCCMQEKSFNPYYAYFATKLCQFDRKFKMAFQFSLWDKFKMLSTDLSDENKINLARLIVHLIVHKALPISILKVIEFADIDKPTVTFLRTVILGLLKHNEDTIRSALDIVVSNPKLKTLRDSLRLFLHHFILKGYLNKKALNLSKEIQAQIRLKCKLVDDVLKGLDSESKL